MCCTRNGIPGPRISTIATTQATCVSCQLGSLHLRALKRSNSDPGSCWRAEACYHRPPRKRNRAMQLSGQHSLGSSLASLPLNDKIPSALPPQTAILLRQCDANDFSCMFISYRHRIECTSQQDTVASLGAHPLPTGYGLLSAKCTTFKCIQRSDVAVKPRDCG